MQGYQDIKKFNEVCMLNLGTAMHEVLQGYLKKVPGLVLSMEEYGNLKENLKLDKSLVVWQKK